MNCWTNNKAVLKLPNRTNVAVLQLTKKKVNLYFTLKPDFKTIITEYPTEQDDVVEADLRKISLNSKIYPR